VDKYWWCGWVCTFVMLSKLELATVLCCAAAHDCTIMVTWMRQNLASSCKRHDAWTPVLQGLVQSTQLQSADLGTRGCGMVNGAQFF
jgi:hypothetical protein